MGGTIAKLLDQGWQVGILDLTSGEPTPHGDETTRRRETACATAALGVPWRENLGLENRKLEATLAARALIANVFRRVRPRWLFAPYWVDAHPDHVVATRLVEDARFWSKLTKSELEGDPFHPSRIFYYFCVHLKLAVQPDFVVDISPHWPRKLESLRCYNSQLITGREHEQPNLLARLETHAAYWGHAIGTQYGEPFASREPIGLASLRELI
jgi:bacillithiol biosynthesis deacetylase BshB1